MEYADRRRAWDVAGVEFKRAIMQIAHEAGRIVPTYGKGPDHRTEVDDMLCELGAMVEEARKKLIEV